MAAETKTAPKFPPAPLLTGKAAAPAAAHGAELLRVAGLKVSFPAAGARSAAVDGASFSLAEGESVALVGESGSGKSVTGLSLLNILPAGGQIEAGSSIRWEGRELVGLGEREMRQLRGRELALVFQDPQSALNPVLSIGRQLTEAVRRPGKNSAREQALRALGRVGIPEPELRLKQYPHQLSGGLRQRVMIAMALLGGPRLLVADEPTTALDATIQAQIMELLGSLRRERRMALLFITHDLALACGHAERVLVMYAGRIVERAAVGDLFRQPGHPYTLSLLAALPGGGLVANEPPAGGAAPIAGGTTTGAGCAFAPRCSFGDERCRELEPPELELNRGHSVRCWRPLKQAINLKPTAPHPRNGDSPPPQELLLEVTGLKKHFHLREGWRRRTLKAVDGVDLTIARGETLAIVGESGCGKSTLWRSILHLYHPDGGEVRFQGGKLNRGRGGPTRLRRRVGVIFQDPYASLDPRLRLAETIAEPLLPGSSSRQERRRRAEELLDLVGLGRELADRLPHHLSGGQRQRVAIARALATNPDLVIADEPVSSLDACVQAQVVALMRQAQNELGLAYLFISHDLALVASLADRVAVMYLGRIVELAPADALYGTPQHPYTRALLAAMPRLDPKNPAGLQALLGGETPTPIDPPPGCRFQQRCPERLPRCQREEPQLALAATGHQVACHLLTPATG